MARTTALTLLGFITFTAPLAGAQPPAAAQSPYGQMLLDGGGTVVGVRHKIEVVSVNSWTHLFADNELIWKIPPPFVVGKVVFAKSEHAVLLHMFQRIPVESPNKAFNSSYIWILRKSSASWSQESPLFARESFKPDDRSVADIDRLSDDERQVYLRITQTSGPNPPGSFVVVARYWQWWDIETQMPTSDPERIEKPTKIPK